MDDIFSLLNINKGMFDAFKHQANLIDDRQLEKSLIMNQRKLKQIEDSMLSETSIAPADKSIEKVMERVRLESVSHYKATEWTFHDLRTISYYLTLLHGDDRAFDYALTLLARNWRSLYFNGLIFYLLNGWVTINLKYREMVSAFVCQKLSDYHDNNKKYIEFKNHANLFETGGPTRLAALIKARCEDIKNAPVHLGFKPSSITLSYYSDVIVNYFRDYNIDNMYVFEDLLNYHDLDRTKKLVLANLVEKLDKEGSDMEQAQAGKLSARILGDITRPSTWAPFVGATEDECKKLTNAMSLVNSWYARKVVDVFFDRCVQDPLRKSFWMLYIPYLKDFRIVGSLAIKGLVESDSRLQGLVEKYFVQTKSLKAQTSALVFKIKNKILVEFSDLGSLYVYEEGYAPCELVFRNQSISCGIDTLKTPSFGKLMDYRYSECQFDRSRKIWHYTDTSIYYGEGRFPHNGYWQHRVYAWIKNVLKLNVNDPVLEAAIPKHGYYDVYSKYTLVSEPLSNGCRVVLDSDYFYLLSLNSGESYPLRMLRYNENNSGKITIKKDPFSEYTQVIHEFDGKEFTIAYVIPQDLYVAIKSDYGYYDSKFYIY